MADQLLSGIKVVECGNLVSAAYTGKLFADFGAEVIKVEEPKETPRENAVLFLAIRRT